MIRILILISLIISSGNVKRSGNTKQIKLTTLSSGWYYISEKPNAYPRKLYKMNDSYFIEPKPIVSVKHFSKIEFQQNIYNRNYLLIHFDSDGTKAWSIATEKALYKKLALIVDDKLIFAPEVNAQITSGISALNPTNFSNEELGRFEKILKSEM